MKSRPRMSLAVAFALMLCPAIAQAQHPAEKYGWRLDNFKDATLPWEIYRETFIGIPPTRDVAGSGFDVLFYDQIYQSELSKEGNCYGMSLMSLMMVKKGGHLGYCLPITQYSGDVFGNPSTGPSDPGLKRAINIMHGHQVNVPTLQHILDIIGKNKNRDAKYAFESFQFYKLKNDPTLVSITKSVNPSDGVTLWSPTMLWTWEVATVGFTSTIPIEHGRIRPTGPGTRTGAISSRSAATAGVST